MSSAPLTLGTAGHIDHGKTALIRALTGVETDRLPQERARGISIELGYAKLTLASGTTVSVIDVPGHERFVRTMVAGATGVDMYLMTVAADDGVMPQTREHASVLSALRVRSGVVAVTKADLADPERAISEAAELLPQCTEIVPVSVCTGDGLGDLRAALERLASSVPSRALDSAPVRLHVDRSFTIRGAGTVITGTLWSGAISRGEALELLPGGRRVRVRAVQVHDEPVERAAAGQRVAVNLVGASVDEVSRGDVLSSPGSGLHPTYLIDAELEFDVQEPEHGDRVQVHHGTREVPARLTWLGGRFWQLRLEQPLVPAAGDRLVIRRIAPADTLGGGRVLDPGPRRHGPGRELTRALERRARGEPPAADPAPQPGRSAARSGPSAPEPRPRPAKPLAPSALELERRLRAAGIEPPPDSELDPGDLAALREAGRAIRVTKSMHYHRDALAELRARVIALAEGNGGAVTLAQLRDDLGSSRKFAQALLEHFDAERLTIRRGEEHHLRRSHRRVEKASK
jgi:selenocysteine-specific elongation factor